MKTQVTEREKSAARLDVEVSPDEIARSIDATTAKLQKEVRLPGFRKGKVPVPLLVQRLGLEAITAEMLEDHLPQWSRHAVAESGLEAIDIIEPAHYEEAPEEGKPFNFHIKIQLLPKAELGAYKGVEAPKEKAEVVDEEVDLQVARLREEFANLRPVSGRPVQQGDFVTLDFEGSVDGKAQDNLSADNYVVEIGAGRILPELEQGICGMSAGEEKSITCTYPDDWPHAEMAGKTAVFRVTVKDVKEKVLPLLNDDFAKDVSEFATLLELRLDIRRKLQSSKESLVRRRFRSAAVQQAVDNAEVELPEVLVVRQMESMMNDYLRSLEMRGVDLRAFVRENEQALQAIMAESRPEAENLVKTALVLDAVAEAEGLEVTDEEIDKVIESLAAGNEMEPAVMREELRRSGRIDSIRQNLLRDKAADLIEREAVAVEPPVPEAEKEPGTSSENEHEQSTDESSVGSPEA